MFYFDHAPGRLYFELFPSGCFYFILVLVNSSVDSRHKFQENSINSHDNTGETETVISRTTRLLNT